MECEAVKEGDGEKKEEEVVEEEDESSQAWTVCVVYNVYYAYTVYRVRVLWGKSCSF